MRRLTLYSVISLSVVAGVGALLWLVVVSIYLIGTDATYSQMSEDGSLACRIPVFTKEEWFWPAFQLFVVPVIVLAASWRTVNLLLWPNKNGSVALISLW